MFWCLISEATLCLVFKYLRSVHVTKRVSDWWFCATLCRAVCGRLQCPSAAYLSVISVLNGWTSGY